jgi:hypothetical protein
MADSDRPKMEDYGSPDGDEAARQGDGGSGSSGSGGSGGSSGSGGGNSEYTGGLQKGDGGQFGEVGDSGVGTDLTMTMEGDVRSGMVKGGQQGEDNIAGPAQYGGEAGDISSNEGTSASRTEGMRSGGNPSGAGDSDSTHGHFGGDGPNVTERPQ